MDETDDPQSDTTSMQQWLEELLKLRTQTRHKLIGIASRQYQRRVAKELYGDILQWLEDHAGMSVEDIKDISAGTGIGHLQRNRMLLKKQAVLSTVKSVREALALDEAEHSVRTVFGLDRSLAKQQAAHLSYFVTRGEAESRARMRRLGKASNRMKGQSLSSLFLIGEEASAGFSSEVGMEMDTYLALPRNTIEEVHSPDRSRRRRTAK